MDNKLLKLEKRAYLAYLVYLLQSQKAECPMHFERMEELEREINQVEARLFVLEFSIKKTKTTIQLN